MISGNKFNLLTGVQRDILVIIANHNKPLDNNEIHEYLEDLYDKEIHISRSITTLKTLVQDDLLKKTTENNIPYYTVPEEVYDFIEEYREWSDISK